jgi:tetratricopeptide (TPR) repeat protein
MTRIKSLTLSLLLGAAACAMSPAVAAAQPSPATQFEAEISAAKAAMMASPDVALAKARAAGKLARSLEGRPAVLAEATSNWLEGEALARLNQPQTAKPMLEAALSVVAQHAPNSKLHGDVLRSAAVNAAANGNPETALNMLHQAQDIYARLGEARAQAIVLQNIGSIYSGARDYPRVLEYYEQANRVFAGDPALKLSAHNNRGNAFKEMGEFAKAEQEYAQALEVARAMKSALLEVRVLTNLASSQYRQGKLRQAEATASGGLDRATGAAAEWRPYLWGVRAQVAYRQGDTDRAERFLEHTFEGVDLAKSSVYYRDFHATARLVYRARGQEGAALRHVAAYKRLDAPYAQVRVSLAR